METPVERVGFWLLSIFLFHCSSRILDHYLTSLHIPLVLSICCLLCLIFTRHGPFVGVMSPIGTALCFYSLFLALSIPTSVWRGNSFDVVVNQWFRSFMTFVLTAGLISTMRHSVKAIRVQSYGMLVAASLAIFSGVEAMGRLSMGKGSYGGANELALAMVVGVVCWWFNTYNPAHPFFVRILSVGALLPVLYVLSRSGSRAAMVSLLVVVPMMFLRYSTSGRLAFMTLGLSAFLAIVTITPTALTSRLLTIFNPSGEITSSDAATQAMATIGSSRQRLHLLVQSLKLTAKNPVFGVGAGNFSVAENGIASDAGVRGTWLGTHNTYTQISSEAGIPALVAFLACFWLARKELLKIIATHRARQDQDGLEIMATAHTLRILLYAFIFFLPFAHIAYDYTLPTFLGIITGFSHASRLHVTETILASHRAKRFHSAKPALAPNA